MWKAFFCLFPDRVIFMQTNRGMQSRPWKKSIKVYKKCRYKNENAKKNWLNFWALSRSSRCHFVCLSVLHKDVLVPVDVVDGVENVGGDPGYGFEALDALIDVEIEKEKNVFLCLAQLHKELVCRARVGWNSALHLPSNAIQNI